MRDRQFDSDNSSLANPSIANPSIANPSIANPSIAKTSPLPESSSHQFDSAPGTQARQYENSVWRKLTWFMILVSIIVATRFFLPGFVEEIQFAITRGKQRAEYDLASQSLSTLPLQELSRAFQSISKKIGPSVVHINVVSYSREPNSDEFPEFFRRRPNESAGQGSGVIVDSSGYVVTNRHVVNGASEIRVSISDGRIAPAVIVGADSPTDIAVLKVDAEELIAAEWANSADLEVGALVWAIGSPFGLERSITSGILSAKNRSGRAGTPHQDFLQTDAPINPGSSGGPLVDASGKVIGITTAIVGNVYQGIGFAVPSEVARDVYERIKSDGRVARGWLGVQLSSPVADAGTTPGASQIKGARVDGIKSQSGIPSPAYEAGIRGGDLIVRWNGIEVESPDALIRLVARAKVGEAIEVVVVRDQQEITLKVIVGERPDKL